eukprot:482481_1
MSSSCSTGRHVFAIGYTLVSSIFTLIIMSLCWSLIRGYRIGNNKKGRTPSWLFYSALIFVVISVVILCKCILYGLSLCSYFLVLDASLHHLVFDIIFSDLYVIQLYLLWIVLFIRLYYIFLGTPYALSVVAIRIYCVIFIFSPLLLCVLFWFYKIFIVLGLSGGIFITLSMIILYIFKLIQVYTHGSDDELLATITKNTILIMICTLFSLLILFILIMNFIFSVYAISYGYQQQFLDICLLLDCYISTCCLIFQFKSLHPKYEYFCGCVDVICRYYCAQFVSAPPPAPDDSKSNNHLTVPLGVLSESEVSPSYHKKKAEIEFVDLPSLPLDGVRGSHRAILSNYTAHNPHYHALNEEKETELVVVSGSAEDMLHVLLNAGFDKHYIERSLAVYVKHYGDEFDLNVLREIIYRLTIKDKIKELKRVQNLYQSRDAVQDILISLNFSVSYVETAVTMYEVMAEMFEINKNHANIYDLELVTEMIMRLRAKDRERGSIKAQQEQERDKQMLMRIQIISTDKLPSELEEECETESVSVDASVPNSKREEELIQQRYARIQGNIPFFEASTTHTKDKSLLDVIPASHTKDNSNNLLDVIADRHHLKQDSRDNTDSLIEITANTNDMEITGEEDVIEEEEEEAYDDTPIHTMPPTNVAVSADQYFDSIIAHNNAELRAHHNMDSKGNDIQVTDEDSFDIQQVFDTYCNEYGSPPTQPKHLIYFAKEAGCDISFAEAITVINANRVTRLKPLSEDGKMKSKSFESATSNSDTPRPLPAPHHHNPTISDIYSADSVDKTVDVIHTGGISMMHMDDDDMMSNDTNTEEIVVVDNVAQHSYEYHNNMSSETGTTESTSDEEQEEDEIEYEEEYYEEDDVFDEVDDDQTQTQTLEMYDDDDEEDEDDDSDDMKQNDYILDLGSLDALLKKDNIKYEKDVIQPGNEAHCIRKMRENVDKIVGNQRSIRTVMVLDMKGKENDGKTCDLYSFKAPKPFGDVANDYLYEQMMHHTSGYLVPHPDDEPIDENAKKVDHSKRRPIGGGFTMARREFTVSFHIHSMDNIEMYVWVQGFGVRFLPRHLIEILPAYFKKNDLKENGIDQKYLDKKFKLKCSDRRFDAWHKKINE